MRKHFFLSLVLILLASAGGCRRVPPPFTEAGGVVLLDGKPLPNAEVEFFPEVEGFGIDLNSTATTDEEGRFALKGTYNGKSGAAVGTHRVIVTEPPVPAELRSGDAQGRLAQYLKGQKNRPIPEKYRTAAGTPLRVEVKADQKEYTIELSRDK